jgi:polar amino acid transport system substrate-binding protein
MIKQWLKKGVCVAVMSLSTAALVQAADINLVGNKVETFINDAGQPARLTSLVDAALKGKSHSLVATTQAWSGSGLRNGTFNGYIDHYSLNDAKRDFLYSQPYAQVKLHVASTDSEALDYNRLDQLFRKRVGIENRFANTDKVRSERSVNWSRSPDFLGNMEQLAGQRVNYIVAEKVMLEEMNKLLIAVDQEPLYISTRPLYVVDITLGMRSSFPDVASFLKGFDSSIEALRASDEYNEIFTPTENAQSILDKDLYNDILKRW